MDAVAARGPYVFRVHGQIYHNTFALHPKIDEAYRYGPLYIIDTDQATEKQIKYENNMKCLTLLLKELDTLLRQINPYTQASRMMGGIEKKEEDFDALYWRIEKSNQSQCVLRGI